MSPRSSPAIRFDAEMAYVVKTYNTPILGQTRALWRDDVPGYVQGLLLRRYPASLIEISTRPEDAEGHHWEVASYLLTENEHGELVRAIEYERGRWSGAEE